MIDITKPVRAKDGRPVTELSWCAGKIVGNLEGSIFVWDADGFGTVFDFVPAIENVPEPPRFVWINVYPGENGFSYPFVSRKFADLQETVHRQHVLRLNLDTGECVKGLVEPAYTQMWHVVADANASNPSPDKPIWTLSKVPDETGWDTDSGSPGYGLTKADAEELARAANVRAARGDKT